MRRRLTKQRQNILKFIQASSVHPTAEMIYLEMKTALPRISLGTVYRNLDVLREMGLVRVVSMPGEPRHYDGRLEVHDHFHCLACGRICDFAAGSQVPGAQVLPAGFTVTGCSIELRGVCDVCNGKAGRSADLGHARPGEKTGTHLAEGSKV